MTTILYLVQSISSAQLSWRGWLRTGLAEIAAVLKTWRRRRRYRRGPGRLLRSGPHLVEDIGLSHKAADREVAKPFWRP